MPLRFPGILSLLKKNFFAGLFVVAPFIVIAWLMGIVLHSIWGLREWVPQAWRPEAWMPDPDAALLINGAFTIGVVLLLAFAVSFIGWVSKQYLGKRVLKFIAEIIEHIPVIRSVYSALDQLLRTMGPGGGQQFSRVVYVEYPRKGVWTLAFVTSAARGPAAPAKHLNIYVPTTPNPTSGFHLLVPEADVKESEMSVEEAFRTILSLGIAQPESGPSRT
jgi:uncharacterized membrane protein